MKQDLEEIKIIKQYANIGLLEYSEASISTLKEITTQIQNCVAENLKNNTLTIIANNTGTKTKNTAIFSDPQGALLEEIKPYTWHKDVKIYQLIKDTLQELTIENSIRTNLLDILKDYSREIPMDCSLFAYKLAGIPYYEGKVNVIDWKKKYYGLPYFPDQTRTWDFLFMYQANEKEQNTRQHRAYALDNNIFLSKLWFRGPIACNTFEELNTKYNYRKKIMWRKLH